MGRNSSINLILALVAVAAVILAAYAAGIVLCPFRRLADLPCPDCGATRAVLYILHGDIQSSFRMNPLVAASTVIIPAGWFFLRKRKISPTLATVSVICIAIAVILNWIYLLSQE